MSNYDSTILIVDDTPENVALLSNLLKKYKRKVAVSGDKALEIALSDQKPDLILLDIMMPGMNGIETCRHLKENERTNDIPVIFISALTDIEKISEAFNVGGVDYVTKPFNATEILARIETHLTLQLQRKELKEGLNKLKASQKQLQQSEIALKISLNKEKDLNKMKSDFISTASHQFRTPLTTIKANCSLMAMYVDDISIEIKEKLNVCLSRINEEAGTLNGLMDNILQTSQSEALLFDFKPTNVDLIKLCEEVMTNRVFEYQNDRQIILEIVGQPVEVYIDKLLFKHIINNLLSNAYKYSAGIPRVIIDYQEDFFTIRVIDNGIGIPEEAISKLFTPFFRATNADTIKGTGLGLKIVKDYIEQHNGTIAINSQHNSGTEVVVKIPL